MKQIAVFLSLVLIACVFLPAGCTQRPNTATDTANSPMVRVRLLAGVDRVSLTATEAPYIVVGESRRRLGVQPGQAVTVSVNDNGFLINGVAVGPGVMVIEPARVATVAINAQPYRGTYRFVSTGGAKFDVVNDVDVDSYLMGVLPRELLADWNVEAYKAQAVIARTYAIYEAKTGAPGRHWDLNPDERSQVYGGFAAESEKSRVAVDATRGYVAAYGPSGNEKIFKAYFSACCGGVSSSAGDVFNSDNISPLGAKYNGNTCAIASRYNWGPVAFTKVELQRRIRAWGVKSGNAVANLSSLRTIEIAGSNAFGRPRSFFVIDNNNLQYTLTAEQMRWAINTEPNGGPTIFSGFFRPVDSGDSIQLVEGHGFGHGVGACQWCMQARALSGENYQQIVLQAYPQSVVLLAY